MMKITTVAILALTLATSVNAQEVSPTTKMLDDCVNQQIDEKFWVTGNTRIDFVDSVLGQYELLPALIMNCDEQLSSYVKENDTGINDAVTATKMRLIKKLVNVVENPDATY